MNKFILSVSALILGITAGTSATAETTKQFPEISDQSRIVLNGTVTSVKDDEFTLNYKGTQEIIVEVDGWDWADDAARALKTGDEVTVVGHIDDDLFEGREIEADAVYIKETYSYFYAPGDNGLSFFDMSETAMEDGATVRLRGTVTEVEGEEIEVNVNGREIDVDITKMTFNPVSENKVSLINKGDQILVYGSFEDNMFSDDEIIANSVVILNPVGMRKTRVQ